MSVWMIAADVSGNFLSHHQVRGAHWGIHRGPPYPLSRNADGSLNAKKQASRKRNSKQVYGGAGEKSQTSRNSESITAIVKTAVSTNSTSAQRKEAWNKIKGEILDTAERESTGMSEAISEARKINDELVQAYYKWAKENAKKFNGMDDISEAWFRHVSETPELEKQENRMTEELRDKYADAAKKYFAKKLSDPNDVVRVNESDKDERVSDFMAAEARDKFIDRVYEPQSSSRSSAKQTGLFSRKTPEQKIERQDQKWIKRNSDKVYKAAYKKSRKEMDAYVKNELNRQIRMRNANGKISSTYLNAYNRKLAEIMNKNVGDVEAPSGRVVRFIPKRGDVGVHVALADPMQNLASFNRGIYGDGRVAYRKNYVNQI